MSYKFVLCAIFLVLVCSPTVTAQHITPQRAKELYIDFESTQACPNCNCQIPRCRCYGWRGQPWSDRDSGGCRCGKKCGLTQHNFSSHWPSPFSVLLDHGRHGTKWRKRADTTHPRLRDKLDVLAHVRLLPPVRKDNGYFGKGCDPYGLLGEGRRGVVVDFGIEPQPLEEIAPAAIPVQAQRSPDAMPQRTVSQLEKTARATSTFSKTPPQLDQASQLWLSQPAAALRR